MASMWLSVVLIGSLCIGLGLSMNVTTSPDKIVESIAKTATVSCIPDDVGGDVKSVETLKISKDGDDVLAFVRKCATGDCISSSASELQVEGGIVDDVAKCYLNVTITDPKVNDSGMYTCTMMYLDQADMIKDDKADGNLVVEEMSVQSLEPTLEDLKKRVAALESGSQNATNPVAPGVAPPVAGKSTSCKAAFSVSNNREYRAIKHTTMKLPDVLMTIGSAYNVKEGVFKAPCDGLYAFHLTVALAGKASGTIVQVRKDDRTVLFRLYAADKNFDDQTSGSTVVYMKNGEKVQAIIESATGSRLYDKNRYTVFTGYLVQEMDNATP